MPFRKDEKFLDHFLADTVEKAEELHEQYLPMLSSLASKYSGVDSDDLIQEGLIGLARASRDFEEGRSETFRTFAIYKIKDAMREFASKQTDDINVPQYIKEATKLVKKLKIVMESAGVMGCNDFMVIWDKSASWDETSEVIKDITEVRKTIRNLADRSGTSVEQLIERAELYPLSITDIDNYCTFNEIPDLHTGTAEDEALKRLMIEKSIIKLKNSLSEDDYELLYDHYVSGLTVRQLAKVKGLSAPTITIRIHNIVNRLQKRKEQIIAT